MFINAFGYYIIVYSSFKALQCDLSVFLARWPVYPHFRQTSLRRPKFRFWGHKERDARGYPASQRKERGLKGKNFTMNGLRKVLTFVREKERFERNSKNLVCVLCLHMYDSALKMAWIINCANFIMFTKCS